MKIRLNWIDVLKGFAIFMVVWGHSGKSLFYNSLYTYHLPLFIMLSGYLLKYTASIKRDSLLHLIQKRSCQIIYPYIMFGVVMIFYHYLRHLIINSGFNFYEELALIYLMENSSNWFLPPLFLSEIIIILVLKFRAGRREKFIILPIISFTCLQIIRTILYNTTFINTTSTQLIDRLCYRYLLLIGRTFAFTIFLSCGYGICYLIQKYETVNRLLEKYYWSLAFPIAILAIIPTFRPFVDLHFLKWNSTIEYLLLALLGCSCIILIAPYTVKGTHKILITLGENTLLINGIHLIFNLVTLSRLIVNDFVIIMSPTILSLAITTITLIFSSLVVIIYKKAFPFLYDYKALRQVVFTTKYLKT